MKNLILLLTFIVLSLAISAQNLQVQGGISISKLNWELRNINTSLYDQTLIGHSFLIGVEYLEKGRFHFSSNVGTIRIGGKDELIFTDEAGQPAGETKVDKAFFDFFTLNTTFEINTSKSNKNTPFFSVGPRVDFLINHSDQFSGIKNIDAINNIMFGFILGAGYKYNLSRIAIGIRGDYYLNFLPIADWSFDTPQSGGKITAKALSINATISYPLKK